VKPEPLHSTSIDFLLFEDAKQPIKFLLFVWRTLPEMRSANGLDSKARAYGLCYQSKSQTFAAIHLAATVLQADVIAHECEHAAAQLRRTLKLDDDEHDEETNAEITGLLNHLVMEELAKI
jgi:hypothetical protein